MRAFIFLLTFLFAHSFCLSQVKKITDPLTPCSETADDVPGIYTDHTNPKYPSSLKGSATQKAAMLKNLIAIEKLEEASRKNFKLTGCAARVSFSSLNLGSDGSNPLQSYGYQLGVYQYVCHVKELVTKIVPEYRTVLRVDINPRIDVGAKAGGIGEFSINGRFKYEIPVEAKKGADFESVRKNNPSKVSQYISEDMMLNNRSSDYKNKHADFMKIFNGGSYTEHWMQGDMYDKRSPDSYKWIDRRYLITKPGVPLLIPVSRKQWLQDMLEYLEIEKANFYFDHAEKLKNIGSNTADWAIRDKKILEEDKNAYPKIYEAKKAKIAELLSKQNAEWLNKTAVVENNNKTYDATKRLENLGNFYEEENENVSALYVLNPVYSKSSTNDHTKPLFMEVQFRYEEAKDRGFSTRLFNNWEANFDFDALRKMLQ